MRVYNLNIFWKYIAKYILVTERARKLRAQYALQAQSLRTRIELRINRIPTSLRSEKMGELFTKYMEIMKPEQCMLSSIIAETKPSSKALPLAMASSNPEGLKTVVSTQIRGTKRKRCVSCMVFRLNGA